MTERYAAPAPFAVGQKVVALRDYKDITDRRRLTEGKTYKIASVSANGVRIAACDAGFECFWFGAQHYFAPGPAAAPTIDTAAIKAGDYVTVRLEVEASVDREGDLTLERDGHYCGFFCPASLVVGHEPAPQKPLAVGDRVRRKGNPAVYSRVILDIDGDKAWTKREGDAQRAVIPLANLERVS